MVDAARQMLDELMGRNRNLHPSEAGLKINWEDPEYCQFYNVKFCPHDLFINTRADLGPCTRIHDDEAKHLYAEARPSARKRLCEDDFLRFCNVMLHDVDRKIQKGKQRLQLIQSDQSMSPFQQQVSKYQEQLNNLNARIKKLLAEAEEAGIRGDVDQAQDLMTLCEDLKEEKEQAQVHYESFMKNKAEFQSINMTTMTVGSPNYDNSNDQCERTETSSPCSTTADSERGGVLNAESNDKPDTSSGGGSPSDCKEKKQWAHDVSVSVSEKQMKVCEICGAFLIVGDAQQRIEDHLMGKQHLGYSKLRNAVNEINEKRQREREEDERRRRDERLQRGNIYDSSSRRDYRERSRDYDIARHQSGKHRHHHKSHHRSSHSRNSSSRNHQSHYHESRNRHSRSRSRCHY